jgi:hypothetical protein
MQLKVDQNIKKSDSIYGFWSFSLKIDRCIYIVKNREFGFWNSRRAIMILWLKICMPFIVKFIILETNKFGRFLIWKCLLFKNLQNKFLVNYLEYTRVQYTIHYLLSVFIYLFTDSISLIKVGFGFCLYCVL